jgi:16S rRNA (uracil1498-N3)-methyltransferase
MALPFFYINEYDVTQKQIVLNEETSKHVVQVLRMKVGEQLNLTDGKGSLITCEITDDHKKHCTVEVKETSFTEQGTRKVVVAISLLKNANRFEWFLEKSTEIGVAGIIPLICERTEKEKFRFDRMQGICISAMLQSQQTWLPLLHEPVPFEKLAKESVSNTKLIAHCIENNKERLSHFKIESFLNCQILIGPEGDFTEKEIELALQYNFIPVSLGETRLRTETAGVVAATLLCLV